MSPEPGRADRWEVGGPEDGRPYVMSEAAADGIVAILTREGAGCEVLRLVTEPSAFAGYVVRVGTRYLSLADIPDDGPTLEADPGA